MPTESVDFPGGWCHWPGVFTPSLFFSKEEGRFVFTATDTRFWSASTNRIGDVHGYRLTWYMKNWICQWKITTAIFSEATRNLAHDVVGLGQHKWINLSSKVRVQTEIPMRQPISWLVTISYCMSDSFFHQVTVNVRSCRRSTWNNHYDIAWICAEIEQVVTSLDNWYHSDVFHTRRSSNGNDISGLWLRQCHIDLYLISFHSQ